MKKLDVVQNELTGYPTFKSSEYLTNLQSAPVPMLEVQLDEKSLGADFQRSCFGIEGVHSADCSRYRLLEEFPKRDVIRESELSSRVRRIHSCQRPKISPDRQGIAPKITLEERKGNGHCLSIAGVTEI